PLHSTALGKVLSAYDPVAHNEALEAERQPLTARTVTDPEEFEGVLDLTHAVSRPARPPLPGPPPYAPRRHPCPAPPRRRAGGSRPGDHRCTDQPARTRSRTLPGPIGRNDQ
ncbi:IclR family transcriptional regulator domain-containing protein, partial [Streptomyces flavofungini]|uniref:IclR family transcriptional regulator domain-containing protein n=1 Tax=Streptomyces flavofungini TaxID=68200 RepID=UPI0034E01924